VSTRRHPLTVLLAAGLLSAGLILGTCAQRQPEHGRLMVTASIFPLADIVRFIGGERVEVDVLIPSGASPHVFEPSPEVYRRFSETRLFVMVGAGLEFWAEKLIEPNAGKDLRVIRAAAGVELMQTAGHDHEPEDHRTGNPHVWLDPVLMKDLAGRICRELTALDPDHSGEYDRNLSRFEELLTGLHHEIESAVTRFSIREFVAFHPSWSYFARRYGLREAGIIQQSPGRNPTPRQIEEIVSAIRRHQIQAVFAEPQFNPAAARAIAEEAGVQVLMLDPLGGPDRPGRDGYLALMRYNLTIMQEAMQ
jgi:zinc transport system substrate-binding protein